MPPIELSPLGTAAAVGALILCAAAMPGHAAQGAAPAAATKSLSAGSATVTATAPANGSSNGTSPAPPLRAHAIVYRASFKGLGAGSLELTLRPDVVPGAWIYETRAKPSFLASFVINPQSREHSSFSLDAAGRVAPQRYLLDDGTPGHKDDIELAYDRARSRVTGRVRGTAVDLPLEPGTQDAMSIRIAVPVDLLADREPAEYPMIDGNELKHFRYHRVGTERIRTTLGELDTVIYTSERKGAGPRDRTWRYWYAPALNWLPVRIEQREDGKTRFEFEVHSLKWL